MAAWLLWYSGGTEAAGLLGTAPHRLAAVMLTRVLIWLASFS